MQESESASSVHRSIHTGTTTKRLGLRPLLCLEGAYMMWPAPGGGNVGIPRVLKFLLGLLVLVLLLSAFRPAKAPLWLDNYPGSDYLPHSTKDVLLVETELSHDEVWTSFLEALSTSKRVNTTTCFKSFRFGIERIIDRLTWANPPATLPIEDLDAAHLKEMQPDIIIVNTCSESLPKRRAFFDQVLEETTSILYCLVHHSEHVTKKGGMRRATNKWIDANRVRFITLSNHVTDTVRATAELPEEVPVSSFPPIFSIPSGDGFVKSNVMQDRGPYFVIQGNLDIGRRNYTGIFEDYNRQLQASDLLDGNTFPDLSLLGSGKLKIPEDIASHVSIHRSLEYVEYYYLLGQATALLPAFANDGYIVSKASSTIPSSIISGSPIIADRKLLDAYTYLPEDAVYLREEGESEVDAAFRVLSLPLPIRRRKAARLYQLQQTLIKDNAQTLNQWMRTDTYHAF